jgi:FtsH-binding integral membrane protein
MWLGVILLSFGYTYYDNNRIKDREAKEYVIETVIIIFGLMVHFTLCLAALVKIFGGNEVILAYGVLQACAYHLIRSCVFSKMQRGKYIDGYQNSEEQVMP